MADFVEITRPDGTVDFVNLDQVGRVQAEPVPGGHWIVKVMLGNGVEIVDVRTESKDEAIARVDQILRRTPSN